MLHCRQKVEHCHRLEPGSRQHVKSAGCSAFRLVFGIKTVYKTSTTPYLDVDSHAIWGGFCLPILLKQDVDD